MEIYKPLFFGKVKTNKTTFAWPKPDKTEKKISKYHAFLNSSESQITSKIHIPL